LYKYHMIHHGYCQLLHYMDMYHIWYSMFIDTLSAVERQNHSLKKYIEMCVLYRIWYKMHWRVKCDDSTPRHKKYGLTFWHRNLTFKF
jgi:hypothetical protein